MEYRLLGPLEVVRDDGGLVELGGTKQRAVLASLLLADGRVVSTERLVEQVWGDEPPANPVSSLQPYISNLRRVLRGDPPSTVIVRQAPGYRVDVESGQVDVRRFLAGARAAAQAVAAGDWATAAEQGRTALDLWRGDLLADLRDEPWVRVEAVSLDERRAQAHEDLITALLGLGRAGDALAAARRLYALAPQRERACWLLLLALYRDGRSAEALDLYREHARLLDEELGLEPGAALRDVQAAILRQDDALLLGWPAAPSAVAPAVPAVVAPSPGPRDEAPDGARESGGVDEQDLVGRAAQRAVVRAAWAEVRRPATRWVVLTGPAGIGKTRLAEQALTGTRTQGARTLRCACPEDAGAPPWWPVARLVRDLGADPDVVLAQDPQAEADRARFAVYERVRALLEDAAAARPLVVLVDDVQWADPSTLGLLVHLAFALDDVPVLVVLTARDGVHNPDLDRLYEAVARRSGTRRIAVPPLGADEVGELFARVSGEPVTAERAQALVTRTGGNPFFIGEYARLPAQERRAGGVPLAVRSVLDRRVASLDDGTRRLVRTAAVLGDEVDVPLLRAVTDLDADDLADLLDTATDAHILVPSAGGRGYGFAHGLLRDHVLAGTGASRRRRLHARVAQALGPDATGPDLPRRAGHLVAALPLVEADEALAACRAAARDAEARRQADAAAHWWHEALAIHDGLPAAGQDPQLRDDLVSAQLDALVRAGRGQTAYGLVDDEVRRALATGRTATVGRLCSGLMRSVGAWPWAAFGENPGPLLATLRDARESVDDDPPTRARLLAALAIGSCYDPDGSVPDGLSRAALELAETLDDPGVLADALLGRALTFSGVAQRAQESVALLDRLAALPPYPFAAVDEVARHGLLSMATAILGDLAACAEHTRLGAAGSDAQRLPVSRVQFRLTESMLALWRGDLLEAERLLADGIRQRELTELYFGWAHMAGVVLRWEDGTLADADIRVDGAVDGDGAEETVGVACRAVARGERATADRLIAEWLDDPGPVIWTSLGNWTLLAHHVADAGFVHHAPRLVEWLTPLTGLVAVIGQLTVAGPVSLALARLHHLLGDDDAAARELAAATELCERTGGVTSLRRCRALAAELAGAPAASA